MVPEEHNKTIRINDRSIGTGNPVYIVAEVSANHNQSLDKALQIVDAAYEAGADAVKLQTYTPDTLTLDCDNDYFRIQGTIWDGQTLYQLYKEAYTPWEWHYELKKRADDLGLDFFSTPFDNTAVDFLLKLGIPAFKIASFELVDIPLLKKIGATGKPVILSTGMASLAEIEEAVCVLKTSGAKEIALLKCTSAYPAPPEEMNLATIPNLAQTFNVVTGLSDHSLGSCISIAAVSLGACIIEKHLTLDRSHKGPDSKFSMEPEEFKSMVRDIRMVEKSIGRVRYSPSDKEKESVVFRRSLFVARDIPAGKKLTPEDVRVVRPGNGLHPRHYETVLKRKAAKQLDKGTPLTWDCVTHR